MIRALLSVGLIPTIISLVMSLIYLGLSISTDTFKWTESIDLLPKN
jgi:hypothetical protein